MGKLQKHHVKPICFHGLAEDGRVFFWHIVHFNYFSLPFSLPIICSFLSTVMCLKKVVTHPQTLENLTLPLTNNGEAVSVSGGCQGQSVVMLTAKCQYSRSARTSTWTVTALTNCSVSCSSRTITHSLTGEQFVLPNGGQHQTETFSGACGRRMQDMFSAVCEDHVWRVSELGCTLMCPSATIEHPQWDVLLPTEEVPVGTTFNFDIVCDSANKTIVTARCEMNADRSDGMWADVSTQRCEVGCKHTQLVHPIGSNWNLSSSNLNYTIQLTGVCDNQRVTLGSARCTGTIEQGAAWNVTFTSCDVKCPAQIFIHPDTKDPVSLNVGALNEVITQNLVCNSIPLPVQAQCQGSYSRGANWRLVDMPECNPSCPQTEWYDPITAKTYQVMSAAFQEHSVVKGICGGSEKVLMSAQCGGDIATGVFWEYSTFNCTPTCSAFEVTHPDTKDNLTLSTHSYNMSAIAYGVCNGVDATPLVTATCGGNITASPIWTDVSYRSCIGYCAPKTVVIERGDMTKSHILPSSGIGDIAKVNGTCALLPFTEITAECVGNAKNGGKWHHTVNS